MPERVARRLAWREGTPIFGVVIFVFQLYAVKDNVIMVRNDTWAALWDGSRGVFAE
jgi:hypothetical protein